MLASHLHVFCFQLEGGVKPLRTGWDKKFKTGRGLPVWGGEVHLIGDGQYPITCHSQIYPLGRQGRHV